MEYTTDSENIYFLNDKNIASGVENACKAGFNAVPAQSAFVEKYQELTGYDDRMSAYVRDNVKVETAALCGEIEGLSGRVYGEITDINGELESISGTVSRDYVKKAGDSIAKLDVDGDLTVGGAISSRYFQTAGVGRTVFTGPERHGGVLFDFENGASDISVDSAGATVDSFVKDIVKTSSDSAVQIAETYTDGKCRDMSGYVSFRIDDISGTVNSRIASKVASLSANAKSAETGRMLDMIGQSDGIITVSDRAIVSDDIPLLPESKVENLAVKYATKQEISDARYVGTDYLKIQRPDDTHICLVDAQHLVSSVIDCSDFVKDGMVETVELLESGEGHPAEDGPYLVITWNAASSKPKTWLAVKKLFNVYKSTDSLGGLSVDSYNIYLNYDVVAKAPDVANLQSYATELSAHGGTVWQLSTHLSALDAQNVRQLKLDGHIVHAVGGESLKDLLKRSGDVAVENMVKNNSVFEVNFEDPSLSALSCMFTTSDGFKFGNRDFILIHDCDASKEQISLDDLNSGNVRIVHSGVSRYEFEHEKEVRLSAYNAVKECVGQISGLNDDSNYETCVSSMTKVMYLLSSLADILK